LGNWVGYAFNSLIVLGHTLLFIGAISVLWGWYFIGLGNCLVMLVVAFDKDGYVQRVLRLPKGTKSLAKGERNAFVYFLTLMIVAVMVNLVFITTYWLGIYEPPFLKHGG